MSKYISTKQVLEQLGISDETLYKWIRQGKIKAYRFGNETGKYKFLQDDIDKFADGSLVKKK